MGKQLFFIGYMAAGKTTAAEELAKLTELPFLDLDAELEARHGKSVAEMFAASGELEFRQMEAALLSEVAGNEAYRIIACGGGLPCTPGTVELMQTHGHVVWLDTPLEVILRRLLEEPVSRPLLRELGWPDEKGVAEHRESRLTFYAKADQVVTSINDAVLADWAARLTTDQS